MFKLCAAGAFFLATFLALTRGIERESIHPDENNWIYFSRHFQLLFLDGDLDSPEWTGIFACALPLEKYLLGLAFHLSGREENAADLAQLKLWDFSRGVQWNLDHGAVPTDRLLRRARSVSALFGALTGLAICWMGMDIFGIPAGLVAGILWAFNPLVWLCGRRAMPDAALVFFLTMSPFLVHQVLKAFNLHEMRKAAIWTGLFGINAGLAASTKQNGVATLITWIIVLGSMLAVKSGLSMASRAPCQADAGRGLLREWMWGLGLGVLGVGIALAIAWVLNPFLHHDPIQRLIAMSVYIRSAMAEQQRVLGPAIRGLADRLAYVTWRTGFPDNFVVLGNFFRLPLEFAFFVIGLSFLFLREIRHLLRQRCLSGAFVALIWIGVTFAGLVATIPLDWERYYLPVLPCIGIVIGFLLGRGMEVLWMWGRQKRGPA